MFSTPLSAIVSPKSSQCLSFVTAYAAPNTCTMSRFRSAVLESS
jgi:hypothetical protein